jgi:hypothetical protein
MLGAATARGIFDLWGFTNSSLYLSLARAAEKPTKASLTIRSDWFCGDV